MQLYQRLSSKFRISAVSDDSGTYFLGTLCGASRGGPAKFATVVIDGVAVNAKVDSGAEVTAVPMSFQGNPSRLETATETLTGPSGRTLRVMGKFTADIKWKNKTSRYVIYIIDSMHTALLGLPALESLGIVKFVESFMPYTKKVEKQFPRLFRGLGTLEGDYTIRLAAKAVPYPLYTAKRIPIHLRKAVQRVLRELEKQWVIRPVEAPTPWCAGIVPVVKPSGRVRICVSLTK